MIGKTITHYHILEKLGEGGMGVVYKARDTHLDRLVALKVLPPEKVADAERKRRFAQEAKAASSLNHPHIVTIHDIDEVEGVHFIAMEYVLGKTLDQLLPRHGMRLNEALKISVQMADALAAAHGAGIVHRDLKPGNIMVGENGLVKVLDFGLAKLTHKTKLADWEETEGVRATASSLTREGVILGTVTYMSPEQAEGKELDPRSDIFSFGSVLYEMVTGDKAFRGDSALSILSAILREEPRSASQITSGLPHELELIIARCLRKDRERRSQNMADVKIALQELKEDVDSKGRLIVSAPPRARRWSLVWAGMVLVIVAVAGGVMWFNRSTSRIPEAPMTVVPLTSYPGEESEPSFSPDGNQVAFTWNGEKQNNLDIYVKLIGSETPNRLTTNPAEEHSPAWSPDGRWIAFLRNLPEGKAAVLLLPAIGGPERELAEASSQRGGVAWSPDGSWLVTAGMEPSNAPEGLFLLSIETGEKRRLTTAPSGSSDESPAFSPDGHALVFNRPVAYGSSDLYLLSLSNDLKPLGEAKRITFGNEWTSGPAWTNDSREIIFSTGGLWRMAASAIGKPRLLAGFGEDGSNPAISRQGQRLAYARYSSDMDIWRVDLPDPHGKSNSSNFISSTRNELEPQYSPDGKRIAFVSERTGKGEIWVCDIDGSNASQLTSIGAGDERWSPDSHRLVFGSNITGKQKIYAVSINGGKPQQLTSDPATNDQNPYWSHDGRWIYFDSDRGNGDVWRIPFQGGEAVQVTRNGGWAPVEAPDGRFLYYVKGPPIGCDLWRIPVEGGEESQVVESLSAWNAFDVVDDGIYFVPKPKLWKRTSTVYNNFAGQSLQFLDFATREVRQIAAIEAKGASDGLSVSPDRRYILYTQTAQQGSDLMLVENFR